MPVTKIRLDALLSRFGYCSRREAASFVKAGRVTLKDGVTPKKADEKADPREVRVDGEPVDFPEGIFIALHKPVGYTCSHEAKEGELIYDLLPPRWLNRNPLITSVGRLDKETSGLICLTDDGLWTHKLTSPKHHVDKVYRLTTERDIPSSAIDTFASGKLMLEGERTPLLPARLEIISPQEALLTLSEGRYHQVRRMMESVGAPVATLHRESIGKVHLKDLNLSPGEWCVLDPESILRAADPLS